MALMTREQAQKDIETYTSLVASTKREIDEKMADLSEYARKLAYAAAYLS